MFPGKERLGFLHGNILHVYVMKGSRSGVQKLIKDENPSVYDVGYICHLADLTVKAGMKTLPLDIDQLLYIYITTSTIAANEHRSLLICGTHFMRQKLRLY